MLGKHLLLPKLNYKIRFLQIYDKNGELVKTLDNGQRHEHVNLKDVPKSMKDAVLATEDNRFYEHGALDYKRLFGAMVRT